MKTVRRVMFGLALISILASCAVPRPYYKTSVGKRKQKYYNAIQFGQKNRPKMKF